MDGSADALVSGATAQVAGPSRCRCRHLWAPVGGQQGHRAHDLAGLAVAALDHVQLAPASCTALPMRCWSTASMVVTCPGHGGGGHAAGPGWNAVHMDGTGAHRPGRSRTLVPVRCRVSRKTQRSSVSGATSA